MPIPDDEVLNKILDQILLVPAHEREAYLLEVCQNDIQLLERIKQLTSGCEVDVPETFLRPSPTSAQWIKRVYLKLKTSRPPEKGA